MAKQVLLDGPVSFAALRAELELQMILNVLLDAIVVEQGVVDIDEKHNRVM